MDDFKVYMNTWKNYNEYGADLEAYGIKDGWMDLDQAIEFAEKYAEDEPFINDVDNNTGLNIEVGEEGITKLKELKEMFEKYDALDDYDKKAVRAILEANGDDDIDNAISIAESGDYFFIPDVSTDAELAEEYINQLGGVMEAVGEDRITYYLDTERMKEEWQDDINAQFEEDDPEWYEVDDAMVEDDIQSVFGSSSNDKYVREAQQRMLDQYFDYDAFGRDLGYDFTFVDDGAIQVY